MLANEDMARVESEAGIIATLIHHPDFSYYSEQLLPNHFTNEENRYIYQAICSLARDGIERIDPYNIIQALTAKEATRRFADELSIDQLYTLMENSENISRNTVEEYKLAVWEREGISRASIDKFSVYYDSFSDRLVYPIRNPDGKIVNIGGRTLDPHWKEKGLRKYTYFMSWGELKTIYGLAENRDAILQKGEIILFEGCKSVLLADTYGIHNTGAILTSHLNPNQMKLLAALGCRVVFALDKDVCIRDDHNIKRLKQFVNVQYLWDKDNLLGEKDSPVDRGQETWKKLYEGRLSWR